MEKGEKINIKVFNWGPCVVKCQIKPEYAKALLDESKSNVIDFRDKLAGQIEDETSYSDEARNRMVPFLAKYFGVYDQAYQGFTLKKYDKKPEYVLSALWINRQKKHEFNPPHDHDGKLSFVIYLKIPEELKKENEAYKGRSAGPGGIQFMYGEGNRQSITFMSHFPEVGDMFIFPAWLKHWVAPFQSKCTRISVSGNIHDSAALNTIPNDVTLSSGVDKDEKK